MKKIKVSTVEEIIAEIDHCNSTLSDREIIDAVKKNGMVSNYDEIKTNARDKVILFIRHKHVFVEVSK